ncbi:STAS domain-containing protein [Chromobacterium piscinae]|uniref:STAS domain-containing protein n=1 Tax=Chromobacterium piscinae TaxID=686831 RepID=A0ABV0H9Q7_9NEIS|nr:STAS domain-containing protein [Chromobacterium vaccinii]MBX9355639.1 STAS domain-containing protein [Chromobacterium vaccinii]
MALRLEHDGGTTRAALDGELTIFTAEEMQDELLGLLNHERVELDLSGITELDGCGAQLLSIMLAEAARLEKTVAIAVGNPLLDEVGAWLGFPPLGGRGQGEAGDGS